MRACGSSISVRRGDGRARVAQAATGGGGHQGAAGKEGAAWADGCAWGVAPCAAAASVGPVCGLEPSRTRGHGHQLAGKHRAEALIHELSFDTVASSRRKASTGPVRDVMRNAWTTIF